MTSQEQQAKYDALVREIAEEMATDTIKGVFKPHFNCAEAYNIWYSRVLTNLIQENITFARITVKHMAEQYERGCLTWMPEHIPAYAYEPLIEDKLREHGLVPPDDSNG